MATEDFTTWTENDPEDDVTVTASRITYDGDPLVSNSYYVQNNYGADYFPGDFSHDLDVVVSSETGSGMGGVYAISAAGGSFDSLAVDDIGVLVQQSGSGFMFRISNGDFSNTVTSSELSYDTTYYLTISRSGKDYTCVIYSDSDRTTEVETITITEGSVKSFSYLGVVVGDGGIIGSDALYYHCENLNIEEAVATAFMKTGKYWGT